MVLSAVNGVGLALVIPNAQSITADYYDELDRGKAFGALYMTSALGGAFGSLYATNQGQQFLVSSAMLSMPLVLYVLGRLCDHLLCKPSGTVCSCLGL